MISGKWKFYQIFDNISNLIYLSSTSAINLYETLYKYSEKKPVKHGLLPKWANTQRVDWEIVNSHINNLLKSPQ